MYSMSSFVAGKVFTAQSAAGFLDFAAWYKAAARLFSETPTVPRLR